MNKEIHVFNVFNLFKRQLFPFAFYFSPSDIKKGNQKAGGGAS